MSCREGIRFPSRNLPGSAEKWGRFVEETLRDLSSSQNRESTNFLNSQRAMGGVHALSAKQLEEIAYAESLANEARESADGKSTVWRSPTEPEGTDHAVGDTWFDESDGNKIYTWDGEKWVDVFLGFDAFDQQVRDDIQSAYDNALEALNEAIEARESADGKNTIHYGGTAPSGTDHAVGDTWFDSSNDNEIHEWDGSAWVPVVIGVGALDQQIKNDLDSAINNALEALDTAVEAQASADGKNTIHYGNSAPVGTDHKEGDTWFDGSNGNRINEWDGSNWVPKLVDSGAISDTVNDKIQEAFDTAVEVEQEQVVIGRTVDGLNRVFTSIVSPGRGFLGHENLAPAIEGSGTWAEVRRNLVRRPIPTPNTVGKTSSAHWSFEQDQADVSMVSYSPQHDLLPLGILRVTNALPGLTGINLGGPFHNEEGQIPVSEGEVVTSSFYINVSGGTVSGTARVWGRVSGGANASFAEVPFTVGPGLHRVFASAVMPANAISVAPRHVITDVSSPSTIIHFLGSQIEKGVSVPSPFFTGDFTVDPDMRTRWLGEPNESESVMEIERVEGVSTLNSLAGVSTWEGRPAIRHIPRSGSTTDVRFPIPPEARDNGTLIATLHLKGPTEEPFNSNPRQLIVTVPTQYGVAAPNSAGSYSQRLTYSGMTSGFQAILRHGGTSGDVWWTDIGLYAGELPEDAEAFHNGDQWFRLEEIGGELLHVETLVWNGQDWVPHKMHVDSIAATNSISADKVIFNEGFADKFWANEFNAGKITAGSAVIANGAITNAKIANLDAAKITTGTLNADRIGANSITSSKLLVTSDNLLDNANFETGDSSGWELSGNQVGYSIATSTNAAINKYLLRNSSASSGTGTWINGRVTPVRSGQRIRLDYTSYCVGAVSSSIGIQWLNASGGQLTLSTYSLSATGTWEDLSREVAVPNNAYGMRLRIADSGEPGTTLRLANIRLRIMDAGELIVDGTITADSAIIANGAIGTAQIANLAVDTAKIANSAITNAKIANLDAAKISSGTIDAGRIGANTISASKLLVTNLNNLVEDPGFESPEAQAWFTLGSASISTSNPRSGSRSLQVPAQTAAYVAARQINWFAVEPGEEYRVSAWVRSTGASVSNGITLRFRYASTPSGSTTSSPDAATTPNGSGQTYTRISGVWTVPNVASARFASLDIVIRDTTTNRTYNVDDVEIFKMSTGELIVDGAITAGSAIIANGAISNAQIANLAVTNAKIADGTIQNAKIGNLDAAKINTGTLDANRIAANSITAAKISGGDFAGKTFSGGIFTGSTIRTAASGARVQLDSTGLRTFNSAGTESARLTAETGGLSIGTSNGTSKLGLTAHSNYAITSTESTASSANSASAFSIADRRASGSQRYYAAHVAQTGLGSGSQGQAILSLTEFTNNTVQADLRTAGAANLFVTSSNSIGVYADAGVAVRANNSSSASLSSRGGAVSVAALNTAGTSVAGQVGLDPNGDVSILTTGPAGSARIRTYRNNTIYTNLSQDATGPFFQAPVVHARTYSSATNLLITTSGVIGRSTSARRYKLDEQVVEVQNYEDSLLSIEFKSWVDKRQSEEMEELAAYREENPYAPVPPQFSDLEAFEEPVRHIGAVSEDFEDAGLPEFVIYNDKGEPDGLQYDRIGPALIPIIRRLKERVDQLEAQLDVVQ